MLVVTLVLSAGYFNKLKAVAVDTTKAGRMTLLFLLLQSSILFCLPTFSPQMGGSKWIKLPNYEHRDILDKAKVRLNSPSIGAVVCPECGQSGMPL